VIIDKLVTAEKNNETDEKYFKKEVYKNFVFTLSNKLLSF